GCRTAYPEMTGRACECPAAVLHRAGHRHEPISTRTSRRKGDAARLRSILLLTRAASPFSPFSPFFAPPDSPPSSGRGHLVGTPSCGRLPVAQGPKASTPSTVQRLPTRLGM